MKLRNFLYLNSKVIEDYISAIDGYIYDEETQAIESHKENTVSVKAGIPVVNGGGEHAEHKEEAIKRSVKISEAAKFDKIYKHLENDEEDGLKYYEFINDDIFNGLKRDDFLEVLVSARFSKMKELSDSAKRIAELATAIESFTEHELLDKKSSDAIKGLTVLSQLKTGNDISCVFEFDDKQYPLVASLNESYFRCEQDNFVGQAYLLCKVIRKIPQGQSVKIDEIFDDIKKLPLNRAQRRKMPKNMDNPAEIRDVIKGPALIVLPIAVYQ